MWAIRDKNTHELVTVADEKPPTFDSPDRKASDPTPWEAQIDQGVEEIVELPGQAQDVHDAVAAVVEEQPDYAGVGIVVIPDTGIPEVTPALTPEDLREHAKERVADEAKSAAASVFFSPDDMLVFLAGVVYKLWQGQTLTTDEGQALTMMSNFYQKGMQKKDEIENTPVDQLDEVVW